MNVPLSHVVNVKRQLTASGLSAQHVSICPKCVCVCVCQVKGRKAQVGLCLKLCRQLDWLDTWFLDMEGMYGTGCWLLHDVIAMSPELDHNMSRRTRQHCWCGGSGSEVNNWHMRPFGVNLALIVCTVLLFYTALNPGQSNIWKCGCLVLMVAFISVCFLIPLC